MFKQEFRALVLSIYSQSMSIPKVNLGFRPLNRSDKGNYPFRARSTCRYRLSVPKEGAKERQERQKRIKFNLYLFV